MIRKGEGSCPRWSHSKVKLPFLDTFYCCQWETAPRASLRCADPPLTVFGDLLRHRSYAQFPSGAYDEAMRLARQWGWCGIRHRARFVRLSTAFLPLAARYGPDSR